MPEPNAYSANIQRGAQLLALKRPRDAVPYFLDAISACPRSAHAFAQLARCYNDIPTERAQVIPTVDQAIALAPTTSACYGLKAWFLVCQMQNKAARDIARHGLTIDPNCIASLNALANASTRLRQWKEVEETCLRMLRVNPSNEPALNLLAQGLRCQGRWKESGETVARLLALYPNDAFGLSNAGIGALAAGDYLRANGLFLDSLRLDPHFEPARQGLLHSLRARNWFISFHAKLRGVLPALLKQSSILWFLAFIASQVAALALKPLLNGHLDQAIYIAAFPFVLVAFYLVVWLLATGMNDFLLLFHPLGRHAMTKREKLGASIPAFIYCGLILAFAIVGPVWVAFELILILGFVALMIHLPLIFDHFLRRNLPPQFR